MVGSHSSDISKTQSHDVPRFTYDHSRWATARMLNVEYIADRWKADPQLAMVLEDPKLRGCELVVLRRDALERMQKIIHDLVSGEADVQHDLKSLVNALVLIETVVKDHKLDEKDEVLRQSLQMASHVLSQPHTTIRFRNSPKPLELTMSPDEEESLIKELHE